MSEETQQPDPSTEVRPPPKFKVDDMVELLDPPGTGSAMGQVIDPEGIDVDIFFSTNSYFHVGEVYRGMEEKGLRSVTPEQVAAFEKTCEMYEEMTVRAVGVDVEAPPNDMAQLMAADIKEVLGEELTLERCEAAIKMTQAARDYLAARPVVIEGPSFERYRSDPAKNLRALHNQIGLGDPDAV